MSEKNLRVVLAYDGTDFSGWQVQANERTIQGEVERVLSELHGRGIRIHAAGRTDSGAHAAGRVISFRAVSTIPIAAFARAMNSRMSRDVRAISCDEVADTFHARYSARWREYKYYLESAEYADPFSRRFVFTVKELPSAIALDACSGRIVGTHDFSTFSAAGDQSESKVRIIKSASFYRERRFLVFRIVGNAFLWKMVRSLVGTILECARFDNTGAEFAQRLEARNREAAGITAPAKGLILSRVSYVE